MLVLVELIAKEAFTIDFLTFVVLLDAAPSFGAAPNCSFPGTFCCCRERHSLVHILRDGLLLQQEPVRLLM